MDELRCNDAKEMELRLKAVTWIATGLLGVLMSLVAYLTSELIVTVKALDKSNVLLVSEVGDLKLRDAKKDQRLDSVEIRIAELRELILKMSIEGGRNGGRN